MQGHFIDGEWIVGGDEEFESINPATGQVIFNGKFASSEHVERAVRAARKASATWGQRDIDSRFAILQNFKKLVEEQKEGLAKLIAEETGKPLWEANTEVAAVINKINVSKQAYLDRCPERVSQVEEGVQSITRHKPHGVLVVLGPFNFPLHLPNGHIVPALLAGNSIVFKPSEFVPKVSEKMIQLWQDAGLPAGVINMVHGAATVGSNLVANRNVDGVLFTGSAAVGYTLSDSLAKNPRKILALEMGGNNPLVVHEIENISAAIYHTIQSAYITAGQRCSCARRLIVVDSPVGDSFIKQLITAITAVKVGPYTDDPEPFMGPVISNEAANKILQATQSLIKDGGKTLVGMRRIDPNSALLTPGLIEMTAATSRSDTEIFGPILQLIRVKDFDAALAEANNTEYGLSAGLLSDNEQLYRKFSKEIKAGIINWNRPLTGASSTAPFGGTGKSGNHRPSAYYAADYSSYPVASMEASKLNLPAMLMPGISLNG